MGSSLTWTFNLTSKSWIVAIVAVYLRSVITSFFPSDVGNNMWQEFLLRLWLKFVSRDPSKTFGMCSTLAQRSGLCVVASGRLYSKPSFSGESRGSERTRRSYGKATNLLTAGKLQSYSAIRISTSPSRRRASSPLPLKVSHISMQGFCFSLVHLNFLKNKLKLLYPT